MARRRRNGVADFMDGFNQGYKAVGQVVQDYQLRKIGDAEAETSDGFTSEQGDQLRAAGESGQYDIGYDDAKKAYTVTPKSDPSMTGEIAQQGVTDFLGKRTAGTMNADQQDRARTMAMAGVIGKSDPMGAMRLRREAKTEERDDARWDRTQKDWGRQDAQQADKDEYEKSRRALFADTRFGQQQNQYAEATKQYQSALNKYEADKAAGKSPDELGTAPVAPRRPEYSIGDSLADRAALVDHDAKYGKLDTRSFGEFSDMLNKVQSEGYERALRLAQSGAGAAEIAKAFNASGKVQLDPAAIVSDKMVKGKDGVETRVLQFKDQNGDIRTINAVAELDAMGKAGEVFSRFYQAEGNRRGNEQLQLSRNADSRAGANQGEAQAARAEAKTEKRDKADSAVALFKDKHPNASDAEINAVRTGIMKAVPETDGNAPSQVKLARAALEARVPGVTDMASALNWAKTNNDKSRDAVRADMYGKALAANMGNAEAAKTATESAMEYLRKASESDSGTGKATPGRSASGKVLQVPQNVTPEDIASTARKYGVSEDEVRRRLGLK